MGLLSASHKHNAVHCSLGKTKLHTWGTPQTSTGPSSLTRSPEKVHYMEWFIVIRDQSMFKLRITQGRDTSLLPVKVWKDLVQ